MILSSASRREGESKQKADHYLSLVLNLDSPVCGFRPTSRSDTMRDYLLLLGTPEAMIQAQVPTVGYFFPVIPHSLLFFV